MDADGAIIVGHNITLDDDTQLHSTNGRLTVKPDVIITATNRSVNISAADLHLDGNISTGIGYVGIDCGKPGSMMSIGEDTQGLMKISGMHR